MWSRQRILAQRKNWLYLIFWDTKLHVHIDWGAFGQSRKSWALETNWLYPVQALDYLLANLKRLRNDFDH